MDDQVYIRDYKDNCDKWSPGIVIEVKGSNTYQVHYGAGTRLVDADQMKKRIMFWEEESPLKEKETQTKARKGTETEKEATPISRDEEDERLRRRGRCRGSRR